jgi:hypothetical protein
VRLQGTIFILRALDSGGAGKRDAPVRVVTVNTTVVTSAVQQFISVWLLLSSFRVSGLNRIAVTMRTVCSSDVGVQDSPHRPT